MSKINAIRLINLNYNNNAIRVSDETFRMGGESTLLSLRNGGGKSVLVQMMMAPFVHRRYQNTKDRPFSSYFTSNKPTFILVEWKLDQGAGFVLTGMMVRKSQEIAEERSDDLEVIRFIAEYKGRCELDIDHLPVVEKSKKDVTLKGFHACKQLFETYKRERHIPFFYYDMNNSAQSRQYFEKLMEYQINYKEWETIIKKVNLKESGLSDLFADCKDEKGLVEKWFLEAVENKLNRDKNRMKEFQSIIEKYVGQYKDNKSKIERRDKIHSFEQEAARIRISAESYCAASDKVISQEARIADFIWQLNQVNESEKQNALIAQEKITALTGQLERLEYEKISKEIHEIADRERFCNSNLQMMQMECDDLERIREEIAHMLHIQICAKQQGEVYECGQERERENQRLLLCRQKEENLEPERNRLGAQLKQYYEALLKKWEEEKTRCGAGILRMEQRTAQEEQNLEALREEDKNLSEQAGELGAKVRLFDEVEARFQIKYKENICRNILGEYEAGALKIGQTEYEKQLSLAEHEKAAVKNELEQYKIQRKTLQRQIEDKSADKIRLESERKENRRLYDEFEAELAERSVILQYFGLSKEDCFKTEKILEAAERKLAETDRIRQSMEKEWDALDREYRRLAQGKVLELSDEFSEMLAEAGIHYVYGMEWLEKNPYSAEKNKQLTAMHPFLPYALIMSRQELDRLAGLNERVYTSFPVPIMVREALEQDTDVQNKAVRSFAGLSFYVWFNDNLLDEDKLKQMLERTAEQMAKLDRSITQKKLEYTEYIGRQEKIKNQKVSKTAYDTLNEQKEQLDQKLAAAEQELIRKREEQETLELNQAKKEQRLSELEQDIIYQSRRLLDFTELIKSYEQYQENRRLLEKNRREKERISNQQTLTLGKIKKLEQDLTTGRNRLFLAERELEKCTVQLTRYQQYKIKADDAQEPLNHDTAAEAENRYEVITNGIGAEQRELEERAGQAQRRYTKAKEELRLLLDKYHIAQEDLNEVSYDRREELHQEVLLEDQERKIAHKKDLIHDEEIQWALIKQERRTKYKELMERCRKEEPIAKADIITIDFTEAIKKAEYEKKEAEENEKQILKKIQGYESNLAALAEYEEFPHTQQMEWEFDFSQLTGAQLTKQKGILIRDYNFDMEQRREARSGLERVLNEIVRMEAFAEDFYRKPLEAMLQLTEDAGRVIRQLDTTLASYRNLMEKLLVDISLVEKEKAKIVELIGDYLKEVHENLNKIDHNSTITIRERPVKMLKIELPDWTDSENFYQLRLLDFMNDITMKGIALLEENQNIQEFLGTRITTKNLYDAVVGIGNVQIRLYKIEEQREYPITWADVARNSGGEGFLSAFVILSALLYYMRRDDTDIFADRNEGKVLLMDNPFAQTNAAHLLKPLMDMAKKTNTQLICLSGLGGESIYNRFDNIYVLTLIAANLRSDLQYLKAEHMFGSQEEEMLVSRIEVMEQQELIF